MTAELNRPDDDEPISLGGEITEEPKEKPAEEEPIQLVDGPDDAEGQGGSVRAFGAAAVKGPVKKEFSRKTNVTGTGAARCRIFHSKIAVSSLEYMENQINEWLDKEQVEIKSAGHLVGVMEGKRAEPNVILVVWY